ncbi:Hermansky-Pudlak syndrome 6 protein-like [Arapaima gigas]
MKLLTLYQLSDFSDFTRGRDLGDFLKENSIYCSHGTRTPLFHVRVSPDGQHMHLVLHKPKGGLMTFDKHRTCTQICNQNYLVLSSRRRRIVVDVVYLDHHHRDGVSTLLVVFEDGSSEFWRFCEPKSGWHLLHTSELCDNPRTKVSSLCVAGGHIVWCERRPPLESDNPQNHFMYHICSRAFEVEEEMVHLGEVKMMLKDGPKYAIVNSGEIVYLLPDLRDTAPEILSRFFLRWSLHSDNVIIKSICGGAALITELSTMSKESNFKGMVLESLTMLLASDPVKICSFSPSGDGGLVLLLSSGWISVMKSDCVLRQVYKLDENFGSIENDHISMNVYSDWLVLVKGRVLHVIDVHCGFVLETIPLQSEGILFINHKDRCVPHVLTETGLFLIEHQKSRSDDRPVQDLPLKVGLDSVLVETVFEEACRRYQKRSLTDEQFTVDKLMSGGMFQAPVLLSSVIKEYLKERMVSNITHGRGRHGYSKLLSSLEPELKKLALLEDIKASALLASDSQLRQHCQILVQEEVAWLLRTEVDSDSILQLNVVFSSFPSESWQAVQKVLQLKETKDRCLSLEASPEVWRTVLSLVQPTDSSTHRTLLPVFELFCRSFLLFQPRWLPAFVDLAEQHVRGLSPSSNHYVIGRYEMGMGTERPPLYKRAISMLSGSVHSQDLEVELLLGSRRPNAILQALQLLLNSHQWGQVVGLAEQFCGWSPLLNKEIFITLLREVSQHRNLDPYLERIWALCPKNVSASSIMMVALESLCASASEPLPFENQGDQLSIALLRPLLAQVLQRELWSSARFNDLTLSSTIPPPVPLRRPRVLPTGKAPIRRSRSSWTAAKSQIEKWINTSWCS